MLAEIRALVKDTKESAEIIKQSTPEGIVEPLATKHVTTATTIIHPPQREKPWFNVSVVNDGPNDCMIVVNTEKSATTPYPLHVNETFDVDMGSAKIVDLLCYCLAGTADLRIRGVR